MTRRRLVALVSAVVFLTLGLVVVATGLFLTRTTSGRDKLRAVIQPFIARSVRGGSIYIGHLSGNFITELTIDSLAIKDKRGELLLSTGPVTLDYDPRDLIDNRIYIRRAHITHPYVHLIQHETGQWNFKEIFASAANQPPQPANVNARSLGNYIVVDSATASETTFLVTMPWRLDDTLRGRVRDSVLHAHLDNPEKAVAPTFDGYGRTYAWRHGRGMIVHARLADPDSDRKAGQEFVVDSLSTDEYEPTFKFRNVSGSARHLGDSIWFQIPHFDMPASTGNGHGRLWWGSGQPVHYDIAIRGDSVTLDDVNWVYPTLPRTGGGTLDLLIKNDPDPKKQHIVDFILSKMDVRSTKSHLVGDMTFGTGAPLLLVQNVDLLADPVDFDLIRTLNGKPFKQDWQGQLFGTVKARGGPLTHFVVDDARGSFRDAHVPGAVSRFTGKGELDILYPAYTAFHSFFVDAGSIDLRSIEYLFPNFPRLGGFIGGTATLDSSWLDVRFSNADITHQDGPGEPSRISGHGRITDGDLFVAYDVALDAHPASVAMLARSYYPGLPVRGLLLNGPFVAKGTAPDLEVSTSLQGVHGALSFDGRVDIDSAGGYGAHGHGQFSTVDVTRLLEDARIPEGTVSGHYDVDAAGETWALLHGTAALDLARTVFDSVRVYDSHAAVHFADGRIKVDSLAISTAAATVVASGGIGLPKGNSDTLHFSINVDSLGGLRPIISHPDTTLLGAAATPPDSMSGALKLTGVAFRTLDSLTATGDLHGDNIYWNKDRGNALRASFAIDNALTKPSGSVDLAIDTVTLGGIVLDTIGGTLKFNRIDSLTRGQFAAGALSQSGPNVATGGTWTSVAGAKSFLIDSLGMAIGASRWRLDRPANLSIDSTGGMRLDSLMLRNRDSAFVAASWNIPVAGPAAAQLSASRIPLIDVGRILQLSDTIGGVADLRASATGTKLEPEIIASAELDAVKFRSVDIERATSSGQYANKRFNGNLNVIRSGDTAITANASLSAVVTLLSAKRGTDSIRGSLSTDTTQLSIVQAFVPDLSLKDVSGRLRANVNMSGTWAVPVFDGTVAIFDGAAMIQPLGVKFTGVNGTAIGVRNASRQDSISVKFGAVTLPPKGVRTPGSVTLSGYMKNLFDSKATQSFALMLQSDQLHAFDKRTLADLYVSTGYVDGTGRFRRDSLQLNGTTLASALTGSIYVDHGSIFLPDADLARKRAVEPFADSVTQGAVTTSPPMFSTLLANLQIQNVPVTLGDAVFLKSTEADVRLTGGLNLVPATQAARAAPTDRLALEGALFTAGGTYKLNLAVVQRVFQVLDNGTVTFNGSAKNPILDIKAQYNVPRPGDRDLGVIVNLHGPVLPYPVIDFSSNAGYDIADSDLLSYLLTGRPGFDFGQNAQTSQAVVSVLAPTLSAVAADRLRQSGFGSWFDVLQFQLGAGSSQSNAGTSEQVKNALTGATLTAEKRIKSNIYLNVNTGFCSFSQGATVGPLGDLGASAEYRFDPKLAMKIAYDPPTANRICSLQSLTGLVPTPGQFSFSLSHTWRF